MTSEISNLADTLLDWYASHARRLPWRVQDSSGVNADSTSGDIPYKVWVSEIMLQQTRVETVIPYYTKWIERFPTIAVLADVSQQEVLAAWEGLGYYARARNLHRAAQQVMKEYDGALPAETQALRKLPGIGRYTAGAIASIAFGKDEPVLDGNVRRVLARYFNVTEPVQSSEGERKFWALAAENLPHGRAGDFNQALMDFGATICTPGEPACNRCPLVKNCQAFALGVQNERPVSLPKQATPHYTVAAAAIFRLGRVLITLRPQDGLLGGMWEFPGGKLQPGEDLVSCLQREICEELGVDIDVGGTLGKYRHAYTHFKVTLHAFRCSLVNADEPRPLQADDLRWVSIVDLDEYPMGKLDRKISDRLISEAAR